MNTHSDKRAVWPRACVASPGFVVLLDKGWPRRAKHGPLVSVRLSEQAFGDAKVSVVVQRSRDLQS